MPSGNEFDHQRGFPGPVVNHESLEGTDLFDQIGPSRTRETVFSRDTILAERFRIVRPIGAGGMGMVYEAIDQTLDRRVAIKCAKAGHRQSLSPEARAAREVSHYNVCKVHDVHTAGEISFLSMEFVEGQTLSGRMRSAKGPLGSDAALEIASQICAGLAQAHKQGVIHGDLKPGNVILARAPAGGVRAVITDFGLAKFAQSDGSAIASRPGGTLDYMAPELFQGEPASVASDVYALGILFHAMLTGHPPARISSVPAAASPDATTKTLLFTDSAEPEVVRRKIEPVPRPWKDVIAKCIDPLPSRRFTSALAVSEALGSESRRKQSRRLAAAVTGVLLLAVGGIGYWQWNARAGPPVRLAVLPFRVDGDGIPGIGGAASDVAERLEGARRNFSVIGPQAAQQNQVDSAQKAKTALGATHVLETHLTAASGHLDAEMRLIDTDTGEPIHSMKSRYDSVDAGILAKALIGNVTMTFGLKPRAGSDEPSRQAYPLYTQGRELLQKDIRNADQAAALLEKAAKLDPQSAPLRAQLAAAQLQRFINGDGSQWLQVASATAKDAASLNPDSVPVLLSVGLASQYKGDYEGAIAAFTRAATIDPDNSRCWRRLAEVYDLAGRENDAIATYRKAIAATPSLFLPYLDFGNLYLNRADYEEAGKMYRQVTTLAPGLASGHMNLGLSLKQLGRYSEAEQEMLKALALRPSQRLIINIGALYYEQERYSEALRYFQDGAKSGPASAALFRNLGDAYRHLKRPKEAATFYRSAKLLSEDEIKANPRSGASRARLALLSALLGDAHAAEFELSQALSVEPGNMPATNDAVKTYEVLGERDKALGLLDHAPAAFLQGISRQPDLKELQQDPRFQQMVRK